MIKRSATPRVTRITGQAIENSFLTSSFFSRGDLMGGIVLGEESQFFFCFLLVRAGRYRF